MRGLTCTRNERDLFPAREAECGAVERFVRRHKRKPVARSWSASRGRACDVELWLSFSRSNADQPDEESERNQRLLGHGGSD